MEFKIGKQLSATAACAGIHLPISMLISPAQFDMLT